jgi:hypothetical protein
MAHDFSLVPAVRRDLPAPTGSMVIAIEVTSGGERRRIALSVSGEFRGDERPTFGYALDGGSPIRDLLDASVRNPLRT